jgi:ribonuclease-3
MKDVEQIIGYSFSKKKLLVEALTHKSFLKNTEIQSANLNDYERLEFLGDTVLNFLLARFFFYEDGSHKEGWRPNELHKMTSLA